MISKLNIICDYISFIFKITIIAINEPGLEIPFTKSEINFCYIKLDNLMRNVNLKIPFLIMCLAVGLFFLKQSKPLPCSGVNTLIFSQCIVIGILELFLSLESTSFTLFILSCFKYSVSKER